MIKTATTASTPTEKLKCKNIACQAPEKYLTVTDPITEGIVKYKVLEAFNYELFLVKTTHTDKLRRIEYIIINYVFNHIF